MGEKLGHLQEFDATTCEWSIYKKRLSNYFLANDITDVDKMRAILLNMLCEDAYKLIYNLLFPTSPEETTYVDLVKKLDEHFKSAQAIFAARFKFYNAKKSPEESAKEWSVRLCSLATACEFGVELQTVLRDIYVVGYEKGQVQDRLMEEKKDTTFQEALVLATSKSAALNSVQVKMEPGIHHVMERKRRSTDIRQPAKPSAAIKDRYSRSKPFVKTCFICGKNNHIAANCFCRNVTCYKCKQKGHYANNCSNKQKFEKYVTDVNHVFGINVEEGNPVLISVDIEGIQMQFQLDSGACISAMSIDVWNKYFVKKFKLSTASKILRAYNGSNIEPIGEKRMLVNYKGRKEFITFFVIEKGGPPILGRDFMSRFGLVIEDNILSCNFVNLEKEVSLLKSEFKLVFTDKIGTFNKGTVTLHLKTENAVPKFFRPRPLPFILKSKVENELERLLNLKIIEPVVVSNWGTPIVPVLKRDGSVRLCGDYKVTINQILNVDKYPLPKIEDLFVKLQGGVYFSKLDLSNAYQQLLLDERSRELTTISTHKGLFRYTRLPFGISSAPGIFQRRMEGLLQNIEGCVVFLDDILVSGKNKVEHLKRLKLVLNRLSEVGLTVAINKCSFFETQINYLGYRIDKDGLHTTEDKIKAIVNAPIPDSVTKLKSFLGLVNYYGKFVKNISSILHPLYLLLKKDTKFNWTKSCDVSFTRIKELLTTAPILVHFDPDLPLKVTTDASDYGIGGVMSHVMVDGKEKPIAYISRTLTESEKNYSQIEKEALSIIWSVTKFNNYLYGRKFILKTDHKPLVSIFSPSKGIPLYSANRLRRWALILNNYNYEIEYVRSKENAADSLSRLPLINNNQDDNMEDNSTNYVNYFENLPIAFNQVRAYTMNDKILKQVINYTKRGWPEKVKEPELKKYYMFKNDFTVENDVLLFDNKIVVPNKLREYLLSDLHKSHMGVIKMKSLARMYFWWPGINKQIEVLAKNCENCMSTRDNPCKVQLSLWEWPNEPWKRIHIDFLGPFLNKYFFVVVDAYTKWIEVFPTNKIDAKFPITVFQSLFARFGLPELIVSDNGTQFTSQIFKTFCSSNGIKHITSAPYYPASNGAAENCVRTVKKALLRALGKNKFIDINLALSSFLTDYRNTPHCTTGKKPSYLMFNRNIRTRFNLITDNPHKSNHQSNNKSYQNSNHNDVKSRVLKQQANQTYYYKGRENIKFMIGELVYCRDYRIVNKPKWIKAIITNRIGSRMYTCKVPELDQIWKRHVNQIIKDNQIHRGIVACSSSGTSTNKVNINVTERPKRIIKPPERLRYSSF